MQQLVREFVCEGCELSSRLERRKDLAPTKQRDALGAAEVGSVGRPTLAVHAALLCPE